MVCERADDAIDADSNPSQEDPTDGLVRACSCPLWSSRGASPQGRRRDTCTVAPFGGFRSRDQLVSMNSW